MYCVGFIPFNFVLASVKVPVYRTNDNGTLERVGTNVEGWVHGHCIDSNQKIQDEIDSVRASLAEIREVVVLRVRVTLFIDLKLTK